MDRIFPAFLVFFLFFFRLRRFSHKTNCTRCAHRHTHTETLEKNRRFFPPSFSHTAVLCWLWLSRTPDARNVRTSRRIDEQRVRVCG
uniref:Putative secreted peptide n=1 Tax=Anopheles braziliensis TaxID=58242 RepID=A0A2M3ZS63_9DIPT